MRNAIKREQLSLFELPSSSILREAKRILFILFTLLPVSAMGQVKAGDVIKGNVVDETGKPMQMVMISELNENQRIVAHAASDVNGDFSLKIIDPAHILQIAYINYETQKVKITGSPMKIVMKGQEGVDLTLQPGDTVKGKVTDENGKPLEKALVAECNEYGGIYGWIETDVNGVFALRIDNPGNKMSVDRSGYITQKVNMTNKPIKIVMKASNEFIDDGEPLIIVDGKVIKAENHIDIHNIDTEEQVGKLVGINPKDIVYAEKITDGAAISVYGYKGKNGVIKIRTEPFEPLDSIVKKYVPGGKVENGHIFDEDGNVLLQVGGGPYANEIWIDHNPPGIDSIKNNEGK